MPIVSCIGLPTFLPPSTMPNVIRLLRMIACLVCCVGYLFVAAAASDEPEVSLHRQIDSLLQRYWSEHHITPAELSDDAEFMRRIYLDLTGIIPTPEQATEFLDDQAANKREQLIDKLLASPDYALHMARVYDVMLTERRIPTITSYDVPLANWRAYLAESFASNKPWDTLVQEILGSDGVDAKVGSGVKFYLVRDVAPHSLTRDVGRLFLGVDLQCAQCHDDPRFDDYRQADYYGIYAFVQRMKLHPLKPRGATIAETAEGKTTFTSVFTAKDGETSPKLPGGEMLADPMIEKGQEYVVKPGKDPSVPSYSRRLKLSERLPRHETKGFARNIANRVWAQFFGRGIVHPLDLHHAANPPSQPELLDRLEQWIVEHKYDLRALMRELVLSDAYQRSSLLPSDVKEPPDEAFAVAKLRGLTAEQLRWSFLQATGRIETHYAKLDAAAKKVTPEKDPSVDQKSDEKKNESDAKPEDAKPAEANEPEPAWKVKLTRNEALERQTVSLITAFAGLPGQSEAEFQPIVDQALYMRNSTKLLPLLQDEPGTRLARLGAITEVERLVEQLYLSVLSRRPTVEEANEVQQVLSLAKTSAERREPLQGLMWGLLLSAEFRLNH
ncbi:MAG: DUF1549 domain-containing protein [Pirellulaceae bacterium]|nr:DUF1549 domain-containing protein [Pirellulaceae bacterium]